MNYQRNKAAIAFEIEDLKLFALYYERVLTPFVYNYFCDQMKQVSYHLQRKFDLAYLTKVHKKTLLSLYYGYDHGFNDLHESDLNNLSNFSTTLEMASHKLLNFETFNNPNYQYSIIDEVTINYINNPSLTGFFDTNNFRELFSWNLKRMSIDQPTIFVPTKYESITNTADGEEPIIKILNLPIIDRSKITWKQVLELRSDKKSRNKLRRFLLFLHDSYEGKSKEFIEDDILTRLEDFKSTCKDYQFDIILAPIESLIKAKNVLAAATAAIGAAYLGADFNYALAAGVSLEIGGMFIEIAKKTSLLHRLKRDHDMTYLYDLSNLFEK